MGEIAEMVEIVCQFAHLFGAPYTLTSSVLSNCEAWYNFTLNEMNLLETVDEMFSRRLLNAPKSVPKDMFFPELGCLPYRYLIKKDYF